MPRASARLLRSLRLRFPWGLRQLRWLVSGRLSGGAFALLLLSRAVMTKQLPGVEPNRGQGHIVGSRELCGPHSGLWGIRVSA